jgi:GR25 family glycosyltransferase involved in LPS biosynthesis
MYDAPNSLGVQPLTQKEYFKGAHAYIVKPNGAQDLLETSFDYNRPTDIYLNIHNFPYLEEYYPWAVYVDDHYTTIQTYEGIQAKHNFQKGRIIDLVEA